METTHSKTGKVLIGVWLGCIAMCVIVMIYGVVRYPAAPIRFRNGGYFDKSGHQFTESEFHSFVIWERSLFGAFALTAGLSIPVVFALRRNRKK